MSAPLRFLLAVAIGALCDLYIPEPYNLFFAFVAAATVMIIIPDRR